MSPTTHAPAPTRRRRGLDGQPPTDAPRSPDGQMWWNGCEWLLVDPAKHGGLLGYQGPIPAPLTPGATRATTTAPAQTQPRATAPVLAESGAGKRQSAKAVMNKALDRMAAQRAVTSATASATSLKKPKRPAVAPAQGYVTPAQAAKALGLTVEQLGERLHYGRWNLHPTTRQGQTVFAAAEVQQHAGLAQDYLAWRRRQRQG